VAAASASDGPFDPAAVLADAQRKEELTDWGRANSTPPWRLSEEQRMPDHPVATQSQHEQELAALDLIEHPIVKDAYRTVAETWLGRAKASDAMRE